MSNELQTYDAVVVGAGFYGCNVALQLAKEFKRVLLVDSAPELLSRASYFNQARVHGGYHYPKSLTTGLRCQANYQRFLSDYKECIDQSFDAIYTVARGSEVSADQFYEFCRRINAPIQVANESIRRSWVPSMVDGVFSVVECAFNAEKIKNLLRTSLENSHVEVRLGQEVETVETTSSDDGAIVHWSDKTKRSCKARHVFLCVYSQLNRVLQRSGLDGVPLKIELAEVALVKPPAQFQKQGITVVCGPYFSVMPFPARGLHSFTHVRFTPHFAWNEPRTEGATPDMQKDASSFVSRSQYVDGLRDATRYLPGMSGAEYIESFFEYKAILPRNESDDGRPILLAKHAQCRSLVYILGGKIDNIYDIYDALELHLSER
jgi:glycine/D-amino acid oxidase-like deaminating enzyme